MYKLLIVLFLIVECTSFSSKESNSESFINFPSLKHEFANRYRSRNLLATDDDYEDKGISVFAKSRADMPRYNVKFQRVSNKFDPTNENYIESIGMITLPGFVIAFVIAIVASCFCCWRCCCGFCGGKDPRPDGYSTLERWIPKIFILLFTIIVIAAAIFGWIGNMKVTKAVDDLFDVANNATDRYITLFNGIKVKLNQVQDVDPTDFINSINQLQDGVQDAKDQVKVASGYFNKYNVYREVAMEISFVFAAVSAAVGVLGVIFNKSFLCKIMFVLCCISLVVQWISFGIHLPLATIMSDFCIWVDAEINKTETDNNSTSINDLLKCLTDASYNPLQDEVNEKLNETLVKINNVTQACCNKTETLDDIRNLNISSFPALFQPIIAQYNSDLQLYLSIIDDVLDISNCSYISTAYKKIKNILCTDMVNALTIIMGCNGVIGCVLVGMAILGVVGWKRFPPQEEHDDSGADEWEEFRESSKPSSPTHYDDGQQLEMQTPYHPITSHSHAQSTQGYLQDDDPLPPYSSQVANAAPTNYAPIEPNNNSPGSRLYPDIPDEPNFNPSAPMQTITSGQLSDEDMERLRRENY